MKRKTYDQYDLKPEWEDVMLDEAGGKIPGRVVRKLGGGAEQTWMWWQDLWRETAATGRANRGVEGHGELPRLRSENAQLKKEKELLLRAIFSLAPEAGKSIESLSDIGTTEKPA